MKSLHLRGRIHGLESTLGEVCGVMIYRLPGSVNALDWQGVTIGANAVVEVGGGLLQQCCWSMAFSIAGYRECLNRGREIKPATPYLLDDPAAETMGRSRAGGRTGNPSGHTTTPSARPGVVGYGASIYINALHKRIALTPMETKEELDAMLGAARFEKYFVVAGENVEKAVQLYRWNTRLAGAFHSQLSYFEILTRNSMNSALQDWNYRECGHRDWSLDHQSADLLYEMLSRPMNQARKWAKKESQRRERGHARKDAPLNHDDVIAQLTLGNWSNLLGEALSDHKPNAQILWRDCLCMAFPNVSNDDCSREDIGRKFERLTRLRNRVSHQENLLETNVKRRLNDMLSVLNAINRSYPHWAMVGSQVRKIDQEDPRKNWT